MPVFKCLMRIVLKEIPSIIIYIVIFIGLALLMTSTSSDNDVSQTFSDTSVNIAVLNRDNSTLGNSIDKYLGSIHNIVDIEDNKESMQDELYYRTVNYILIIPEGFEQSVITGEMDVELENIKLPESTSGAYLDMQIQQYLTQINIYLNSGYSLDDAIEYAESALEQQTEVQTAEGYSTENNNMYFYFQFLAYIFIAMMISIIGPVLIVLNKKGIMDRTEISSFKLRKKNNQMILGIVICTIAFWLLFIIVALILYKDDIFSENGLYCILNSLIAISVSSAIAFLVGSLIKSRQAIAILSNIVALGTAFLCGVFVPQELLSSSVLAVSKFLPMYWYVNINDTISNAEAITTVTRNSILQGMGIQIIFIVAIISITLMITRYKKNNPTN